MLASKDIKIKEINRLIMAAEHVDDVVDSMLDKLVQNSSYYGVSDSNISYMLGIMRQIYVERVLFDYGFLPEMNEYEGFGKNETGDVRYDEDFLEEAYECYISNGYYMGPSCDGLMNECVVCFSDFDLGKLDLMKKEFDNEWSEQSFNWWDGKIEKCYSETQKKKKLSDYKKEEFEEVSRCGLSYFIKEPQKETVEFLAAVMWDYAGGRAQKSGDDLKWFWINLFAYLSAYTYYFETCEVVAYMTTMVFGVKRAKDVIQLYEDNQSVVDTYDNAYGAYIKLLRQCISSPVTNDVYVINREWCEDAGEYICQIVCGIADSGKHFACSACPKASYCIAGAFADTVMDKIRKIIEEVEEREVV